MSFLFNAQTGSSLNFECLNWESCLKSFIKTSLGVSHLVTEYCLKSAKFSL